MVDGCRRDLAHLLSKEWLILVVVTDPIPEESVFLEDRQSSVASANANRPDRSALLESQGRMPRVLLPKTICSMRPAIDVRGEARDTQTMSHSLSMTSPRGFVLPSAIQRFTAEMLRFGER